MPRRWRVAVLGLGHWYSAYGLARALAEYDRAELVAAAANDPAQLAAFTAVFGVPGYADAAALLARERVDIVHLAAPVSELAALTIQCAEAGAHLLLGKPMAMSLGEADRMIAAVEAAGVACFPFQGLMRLRCADLKARIDAGEIGPVALLHQASRWSIAEDALNSGRPGWFADPAHVPGGALIDEGIYWIDLFEWLAGPIVEVEARTANLVHTDIAVEDWGMATFTCQNGVVATLEASWTINAPQKTGPSPKQNAVVRLEVIGTRGEIIDQWFRSPGRAILAAGAADWVFERQPEGPTFAPPRPLALHHLIECIETGAAPVTTIREARRSLAAALAAYESAKHRRAVRLS